MKEYIKCEFGVGLGFILAIAFTTVVNNTLDKKLSKCDKESATE